MLLNAAPFWSFRPAGGQARGLWQLLRSDGTLPVPEVKGGALEGGGRKGALCWLGPCPMWVASNACDCYSLALGYSLSTGCSYVTDKG